MPESLFDRLRRGLTKTRRVLEMPVQDLLRGRRPLDPADLDAVEEALLAADMGVPSVQEAMEMLRARSGEISSGGREAMLAVLRESARKVLERPGPAPSSSRPRVVFVVGVNGVGKTTSIGKL